MSTETGTPTSPYAANPVDQTEKTIFELGASGRHELA